MFKLTSNNSEFNDRANTLFESLASAEHEQQGHSRYQEEDLVEERPVVASRTILPPTKFAKPTGCAPRRSYAAQSGRKGPPDYLMHPEKWTRYSMEETLCLSNQQNAAVALEFMNELNERKPTGGESSQDDESSPSSSVKVKPQFKKLFRGKDQLGSTRLVDDDEVTAQFGGTKKTVMPEYEVGRGKKRKVEKSSADDDDDDDDEKSKSSKKSKEMKLSYLSFADEEEEEEED